MGLSISDAITLHEIHPQLPRKKVDYKWLFELEKVPPWAAYRIEAPNIITYMGTTGSFVRVLHNLDWFCHNNLQGFILIVQIFAEDRSFCGYQRGRLYVPQIDGVDYTPEMFDPVWLNAKLKITESENDYLRSKHITKGSISDALVIGFNKWAQKIKLNKEKDEIDNKLSELGDY